MTRDDICGILCGVLERLAHLFTRGMEKVWTQCITVEQLVLDITRLVDNDHWCVDRDIIIVIREVGFIFGCYRFCLINDMCLVEA